MLSASNIIISVWGGSDRKDCLIGTLGRDLLLAKTTRDHRVLESVQNTPLARGHQQASQHLFVSNFLVSSLAPPVPPKTTEFAREIATRRRAQIREPIT